MPKWSVAGHVTTLTTRSYNTQSPESCPEALWATTHGQAAAALGESGGLTASAELHSTYCTAPAKEKGPVWTLWGLTERIKERQLWFQTKESNVNPDHYISKGKSWYYFLTKEAMKTHDHQIHKVDNKSN